MVRERLQWGKGTADPADGHAGERERIEKLRECQEQEGVEHAPIDREAPPARYGDPRAH